MPKAMTKQRWKEINREYRKALKTLREHYEFEALTFTTHPSSDRVRGDLAALVPELLSEIRRLRRVHDKASC